MSDNYNATTSNGGLYGTIWRMLKKLFALKVENVRLTVAERLTIFLVGVISFLLLLILGAFILAFLSNALVDLLTEAIPAWTASLILAGIYLAVTIIVYLFRKPLIIRPVARFVSRLIIEPPKEINDNEKEL